MGYTHHVAFSDHYLVGLTLVKPKDLGLRFWQFPVDILDDPNHVAQIQLILDNFDKRNLCASWENKKQKIQTLSMKVTAYHQKQRGMELKSLKQSLCMVNKLIFEGNTQLNINRI